MVIINVDTASVEELQLVPGIGPKIAATIVRMRETHGGLTKLHLATIPQLVHSPELWTMLSFPSEPPREELPETLAESSTQLVNNTRLTLAMNDCSIRGQSPFKIVKKWRGRGVPEREYNPPAPVGGPQQYVSSHASAGVVKEGSQTLTSTPLVRPPLYPYQMASPGVSQDAPPVPPSTYNYQMAPPGIPQYAPPVPPSTYNYQMASPEVPQGYWGQFPPYPMPGMWPWMFPYSPYGQSNFQTTPAEVQCPSTPRDTTPSFAGEYAVMPLMASGPSTRRDTTRSFAGEDAVMPLMASGPSTPRDTTPSFAGEDAVMPLIASRGSVASTDIDTATKDRLLRLPKSLRYDGNSSWQAFYSKFQRYAGIMEWSEGEKRDYLCLCLTDKASEFYALAMDKQEDTFSEMVEKLERRFGSRGVPVTARVSFSGAQQGCDESLDDWADRVRTLAGKAFRDLPDQFTVKQSILRFCAGAREKEAGQQVIDKKPQTMEEALDKMKWAIHIHSMAFSEGKLVRKVVLQEAPAVVEVQTTVGGHLSTSSSGLREDRLDKLEARVSKLEDRVGRIEEGVQKILDRLDMLTLRAQDLQCCLCNEKGHNKSECPESSESSEEGIVADKKVSFIAIGVEGLNVACKTEGTPGVFNQVKSKSMFKVDIKLNGVQLEAVVDTAAEVSLVSDKVVERLPADIPLLKQVMMKTAGRGLRMRGAVIGPLHIQLCGKVFNEMVYMAPIGVDMLLGLDILRKYGAFIDLPRATLTLEQESTPMDGSVGTAQKQVVTVSVVKRTNVPLCRVEGDVEVVSKKGDLSIPATLFGKGDELKQPVVNFSEQKVTLMSGRSVAVVKNIELVNPVKEQVSPRGEKVALVTGKPKNE